MEAEIPALEYDDDYRPLGAPHITWRMTQFATTVDINTQYVATGAVLALREGRRTLSTVDIEGSRYTVRSEADEVSMTIGLWVPVLRLLADAVGLDRDADSLKHNAGQFQLHWQTAQGRYVNAATVDAHKEDVKTAYAYEDLIRSTVPLDSVDELGPAEAALRHVDLLQKEAKDLRARAVVEMPHPDVCPLPGLSWIGPYSNLKRRDIWNQSEAVWYADLPHQLLAGWRVLGAGGEWLEEERIFRRDSLVRSALRRGLPKMAIAKASGLSRSTIDRIVD